MPWKFVWMNNQEFKIRPEIVNVSSDEPVFYASSIKKSKFSGSCNNINYPCAKNLSFWCWQKHKCYSF